MRAMEVKTDTHVSTESIPAAAAAYVRYLALASTGLSTSPV
jgi:hypothetical protein